MGFFRPLGGRPNPVRPPTIPLVCRDEGRPGGPPRYRRRVLSSWEAYRDPALARGQLGNLGDGADLPSHVSGEHSRDLPLEQALAAV